MEATKEKHATFTPGPWHDRGTKISIFQPFATAYQVVATVEDEKDARLIAAAPDLLAQCKEFEKCLTHLINSGDSGADLERDKLREVLAKVEGGEG
jgi:hypothetical protein